MIEWIKIGEKSPSKFDSNWFFIIVSGYNTRRRPRLAFVVAEWIDKGEDKQYFRNTTKAAFTLSTEPKIIAITEQIDPDDVIVYAPFSVKLMMPQELATIVFDALMRDELFGCYPYSIPDEELDYTHLFNKKDTFLT